MFDHSFFQGPAWGILLASQPPPHGFAGWLAQPAVHYPLGAGIFFLLLLAVLRWPDFTSWMRGRHRPTLRPVEFDPVLLGASPVVIDLRPPEAFNGPRGHLRGARNIPFTLLPGALQALEADRRGLVVLVDGNDRLSHHAAPILEAAGFQWVRVLRGGMRAWRKANLPVAVTGHHR